MARIGTLATDGSSVSEIHRYPVRPEGFAEPLFLTGEHKKEIAEHLAASGWLWKASEATPPGSETDEPVEVARREGAGGSRIEVHRSPGRSPRRSPGRSSRRWRGGWTRRRVSEVVERWREVDRWWSSEGQRDRYVFRVSLDGGTVVDLALDRPGRAWTIAGVVD